MKTNNKSNKLESDYDNNNIKLWLTTLDAMNESVILMDLDHKILQCNKATLDLAGKSSFKEIIGHSCWEIVHDTSEAVDWCPVKKMRESGHRESTVQKIKGKWVEISAEPVFDDMGVINGAVHIITDITDRRQAEVKLKASEERYRLISENANDMIAILNEKMEYEYVNEVAFQKIMGRNRDVLIGENALHWVHPDDADKCLDAFKEGWAIGEATFQARFKDESEKYRWLEVKGGKIVDQNGEPKILIVSRDISERKEYEEKLKISEEKYRYLIENALEGVWVIDSNADTILVNPSMAKMLGYKIEEMIGKSLFLFMDENQTQITKTQIDKRKKGISGERDAEMIQKNGKKVFLRIRGTPIFDKDGNYEGTYAFLADVTQHKLAEEKLKESEEKYRLISENTDDLIAVYDENGNVEYLNAETHSRILGYKPDKFIDKSFRDTLVHEEDREIAKNSLTEGLERGGYYYQFRLKHQLGYYIWFEVIGKTFIDDYGKNKLLCVSSNINLIKIAEQKIKESEENFRTIAEQAFMGILIIQYDQVEYANNALLQIFEFSEEEINKWSKEDLLQIIHPDDLTYLRDYRHKLRADDPNVKPYYSYRVFTKSGKLKWIDQFSRPIIYKEKPAELVTIMDITEKKEAEQELVKLTNLKSELLRRTSHELKTPLVSIKGFSDLLLNVHREKLDDYVLATVYEIKLGCERLETLIQDILKTSELESGVIQLKKTEGDLSFLIKLSMRESQGLIKLRNHTINLNIHDKLLISIEQEQIHQVISNLINNAIKYTPPEGIIEIYSEINEDFIMISIKDSGIGITMKEKENLFKQFGKIERYGQGLDIISEGSGLGLFISKKIIELHGGELWVESEGRNKGSTFYFTLPIISENAN